MSKLNEVTALAVYGTLRRGHHNWQWALSDATILQESDLLSGYSMRTHGGFPAIFETCPADRVVVDVIDLADVPDREVIMQRIDRMEMGCGYTKRLVRTEAGHYAWTYVMPADRAGRFPTAIEDGDWNSYCNGGRY